jgi:hypothetical protein
MRVSIEGEKVEKRGRESVDRSPAAVEDLIGDEGGRSSERGFDSPVSMGFDLPRDIRRLYRGGLTCIQT